MIKVVLFDYGGVLSRMLLPRLGVRRLARKIHAAGVRVGILSNMVPLGGVYIRLFRYTSGFDPVIFSYQEGVRKPAPRIYDIAIKKLGVKPSEVLFIDNRLKNLAAAEAAGMQTIQARSSKKLRANLKEILYRENGLSL